MFVINYIQDSIKQAFSDKPAACAKSLLILEQKFPEELFVEIFQYLSLKELGRATLVSKQWLKICTGPQIMLKESHLLIKFFKPNLKAILTTTTYQDPIASLQCRVKFLASSLKIEAERSNLDLGDGDFILSEFRKVKVITKNNSSIRADYPTHITVQTKLILTRSQRLFIERTLNAINELREKENKEYSNADDAINSFSKKRRWFPPMAYK